MVLKIKKKVAIKIIQCISVCIYFQICVIQTQNNYILAACVLFCAFAGRRFIEFLVFLPKFFFSLTNDVKKILKITSNALTMYDINYR